MHPWQRFKTRISRQDPKKKEERQGRLVSPKNLHRPNFPNLNAASTLQPASRDASRSRSRLGRAGGRGRRGRKGKKAKRSVGLFVTKELNTAIETTKASVERIARQCRAQNKRFRDTEFDLEYDEMRCLHGYAVKTDSVGKDIQRVTEIFDKPIFFPPGGAAKSTAIKQGLLNDCYFLSALATVSGLPGLIEKICVARDEEVGIYGFIFYQDRGWVSVIVDDMLCTNIPKYESLDEAAKGIYHEDKERFEAVARKGGHILTYAKAGTSDETWVPIIEKAYAKLYGCYAHIDSGGHTREAIEDLTGGVANMLNTRDILNVDKFWREELCRVNKDRIFACSFLKLAAPQDSPDEGAPTVQGLMGSHAYAVLRAVEVNNKRFVVVRNPWGEGEWEGPWSDGSKEWTTEWLKCLPQIKHTFGNDGQFVMEYKDFLRYFTQIDRVLLFDDSWTVAFCWLHVPTPPIPAAPTYGTLSYVVTIPKKTKAIFVLSRLNCRAFDSIGNKHSVTFEYSVVKAGDKYALATGGPDRPFARSGTIEIELEAGDYIVYVKLDQWREVDPESDYKGWLPPEALSDLPEIEEKGARVISKILTNKVKAISLTQNWDGVGETDYLVKTLEQVIEDELDERNRESEWEDENEEDATEVDDAGTTAGHSDSSSESDGGSRAVARRAARREETEDEDSDDSAVERKKQEKGQKKETGEMIEGVTGEFTLSVPGDDSDDDDDGDKEVSPIEWIDLLVDKGEQAALGLRVYTKTRKPALITGRIKSADGNWEW